MKKKMRFFDLTNDELKKKIYENIEENELLFQEIFARQDNGRMKKGKVIEGSLKEYLQNEVTKSRKSA